MLQTKSPSAGTMGRVVIFDDEPGMGRVLEKTLRAKGFDATSFTNPIEGFEQIDELQPDVLLTDMRMPEMDGLQVLERIRKDYPDISVLVLTAFGTVEGAVQAMQAGALNYITKPFEQAGLLAQIERAVEHRRVLQENASLSARLAVPSATSNIIGISHPIMQVRDMIDRAAPTDSSVLITGKSGVGKELVASSIHRQSRRHENRFVAINCPSIPASLIESEMFGHEKGAFTGADRSKMGLIELAQGGTLFLDEIAELPNEIQVKLLRVLQEREIQRVGGLRQIPVNIRVIATTNRDLAVEMREGRFREDLFFRLNVIEIRIPPLSERREDIPLIAAHILRGLQRSMGKPGLKLGDDATHALMAYDWPGNVRELENVLERAVVLSRDPVITLQDLPADIRKSLGDAVRAMPVVALDYHGETLSLSGKYPINYKKARDQFERQYLLELVDRAAGNMTNAAKMSKISRRNLYEKLDKVGLADQLIKKRD